MNKAKIVLLHSLFLQILFSNAALANESSHVKLTDAWIREAPPTVAILAGYINIKNDSDDAITLVTVSSPDFTKVEIHRSIINDGMATMEKQSTLIIPAGEIVKLTPGDHHLMLFDPENPLRSGDNATLIFSFADGHTQSIAVEVERRSSGHAHHHNH
jgi:periplasmic copper chaperone A